MRNKLTSSRAINNYFKIFTIILIILWITDVALIPKYIIVFYLIVSALYTLDIVLDIKTLNERLDNHTVIPHNIRISDEDYEFIGANVVDKTKGNFTSLKDVDLQRIISNGGKEYIAYYRKVN